MAEFVGFALLFAAAVLMLTVVLPGRGAAVGALALLTYGVAVALAGRGLHRHYPHARLGLCNLVTLARLALVSALVAPLAAGAGASWPVFAVAAVALSLDGVDGWLARRQGLVSDFGARFDMEVDSALALVLALNAAAAAGPAALLLGLPRYLFGAAAWGLPWMRRDLPVRFSRKAVCVVQLAVLIALQAPVLPDRLGVVLVPAVAAALAWSFAIDLRWLWRQRT